ncbi:hypothetical protein P8C59_009567 [Phyllachora maydis]|uniref:Uncharacterized protein n=1 Tax=Phyllachora maydis TaxID=1825666 RepID=A0AAD9ICV9_9PEZI|nr:hypothetical protein P8C59_009567 [Phyllachora maydis]
MHLLRRSCRIEADSGQSSRPPPPIRTLLEDEEDGEDYSEVIEALKQHMKSYKRVIAIGMGRFSYYILPILFLPIIYTSSSSSSNNNSSSSSSNNNSSSISSTSSNNCLNADSAPFDSKGLIARIHILLEQATTL